ncbi:MAG: polyribonucleotide nucleotidyltransferase [Planctomycetota bacterium]|nr:MAG: polyribonucleotide nucleotidyltransferase [Planctomycetota bacterium]
MHKHTVEVQVGSQSMRFETGYLAKQAAGSVVVGVGETMVLSTVCDGDPKPGQGFFPLMVDYREKAYAAGRIPGNFFKREARPSDHETLTMRLTDRPLRPLFPKGYMRDTNCTSFVISFDQANESDVLSMNGVSAALHISQIPWAGPIGAVRVGLIDNAFVVNPEIEQRKASELDLVVAGTADAITMVECGAKELSEERMVEALFLAHSEIKKICAAIEELRSLTGKAKMTHEEPPVNPWIAKILEGYRADIEAALDVRVKHERSQAVSDCKAKVVAALAGDDEERIAEIKAAFAEAKDTVFRDNILNGKRVDGRDTTTVRPIVIDLDVLPRAHGSSVFTRGETQGLLVCTLGTGEDEQMVDGLKPKYFENFLLHYNFPGFSVGECGGRPGPGRREIGHGALARRALIPVLPEADQWPYTIRIVSDILESNGSSSMATVCGGSLSMMAAGVPIKAPVAGIAMGLVKEGDRYAILTDILGDEDHYGDMDFKVCGTSKGITALQMDIKIAGLSAEVMAEALNQAKVGRLHILGVMNESIATNRDQLSPYAPQIVQVQIDPEMIGKIIGKGGETIRRIQDETGAKLNVDDDGVITLASPDMKSIEAAKGWISDLTEMPEAGRVYKGRVTSVKDFGAFVEFLPSTEGLCHISEWAWERIDTMDSVAKTGQEIDVKLVEVDPRTGKFRLSRKALLEKPEGYVEPERAPRGDRPPRRDDDRRRNDGPRR